MSLLTHNTTPAERMRGCVFSERFESREAVVQNGGVISGTPPVDFGILFGGVSDVVAYRPVSSVKSITFRVTPETTTEDLMQLSTSHSVEVVAGTLTATGLATPTFYVDGVATSTMGTGKHWVTIVTATAFDADSFTVGQDDSFGQFRMHDLKLWTVELTAQEALDLYNQTTYDYMREASLWLPMDLERHDPTNVQAVDISGKGNHAQLGDGVATALPTKLSRRGYSFASDYMVIPTTADLDFADADFTIGASLEQGNLAADQEIYDKRTANLDGLRFQVTTLGQVKVFCDAGSIQSAAIPKGKKYTAIVRRESGQGYLYINGVLEGTGTISANVTSPNDVWLGSRSFTSPSRFFTGKMFSVFSRKYALTPTQVCDLHLRMLSEVNHV